MHEKELVENNRQKSCIDKRTNRCPVIANRK